MNNTKTIVTRGKLLRKTQTAPISFKQEIVREETLHNKPHKERTENPTIIQF